MTTYDISNLVSGKYLGEYDGDTPDEAARAMDRDAGYTSDESVLGVLGLSTWEERMSQLVVTAQTREEIPGCVWRGAATPFAKNH